MPACGCPRCRGRDCPGLQDTPWGQLGMLWLGTHGRAGAWRGRQQRCPAGILRAAGEGHAPHGSPAPGVVLWAAVGGFALGVGGPGSQDSAASTRQCWEQGDKLEPGLGLGPALRGLGRPAPWQPPSPSTGHRAPSVLVYLSEVYIFLYSFLLVDYFVRAVLHARRPPRGRRRQGFYSHPNFVVFGLAAALSPRTETCSK